MSNHDMSTLRRILAEEGFGKAAVRIDILSLDYKLDTIRDLTDRNDHTEAAKMTAHLLGERKIVKVLEHVAQIQKILGHMPHELSQFRSALMKPVFAKAKKIKIPDGSGTLYDLL